MSAMSNRLFRGTRVLLAAASKAATTTAAKPSSSSATSAAPTVASKKKAASATAVTTTKTTARSKSATAVAKPPQQPKTRTNRTTGIFKLVPVSPALHNFLGVSESSRSDAVKKVWEYIKLHDLQNPANKREIKCDDKLKILFDGKDKVEMLEIARMLSQHFVKTG